MRWGGELVPAPMGSVWIHAASVGEVAAAEVLWRALPGRRFVTADTDAGLARARRFTPLSARRPADRPGAVEPVLAQARPRALVFVEGTWWPWLAIRARRAGVPVLRVSCRAGPRTRNVPKQMLRRLWSAATAVAAKNEDEAAFLRSVHHVPVTVLGDLKVGIQPAASPLHWTRPFVVGASVHPEDVEAMVAAWRTAAPNHTLLLAPRHPARLDPASLLPGMRWMRRSALPTGQVPADIDILWLDTLGELGACLEGAAAAFVGGTFDEAVGGHAADEALAWGVPVVAGPCRRSNPGSLVHAELAATPADLGMALERCLRTEVPRRGDDDVGGRIARFVLDHASGPCPELAPRPWARPLVPLWRGAQRLDAVRRARRHQVRVPVPVLSVGSANARSPGRTSTVTWLAERLREQGHRVGIALRGYRRSDRGLATSWSALGFRSLGDEGAMLAGLGHDVAASRRRGEAVAALASHGCSVVVLDDGRQCTEVERDLEVEVIDGRYPGARGPLPMGERRTEAWGQAPVCLVHHPDAWPERPAHTIRVDRRMGPWRRGGVPQDRGPEGPVAVWLGLGHPEEVLSGVDRPVARQRIDPDHAPPPTDLDRWCDGLPLVCTDKDRSRLSDALAAVAWTRPVELTVGNVSWLAPFLGPA